MRQVWYGAFFGTDTPTSPRLSGAWVGLLACVVLAFNAAGQIHWGGRGLLFLLWVFVVLGGVGLYWYSASVYLLAGWLNPTGQTIAPSNPPAAFRVLQGFWPLMLLGPAVSLQQWWSSLGTVLTLLLLLGTGFTLVSAIRQTYGIPWVQSVLCFGLTLLLGSFGFLGLVGWPMMFLLGVKHFNIY